MATTESDPFLQVQADVLATLNNTRPLFSSYKRIRSLATSPQNPELVAARDELETTLQDLTADLADLVESVRAVELDPYRFGIELDELQRRRGLVDDVGREIEEMREELRRTVEGNVGGAQAHGTAVGGKGGGAGLPNPSDFDNLMDEERDEDYYAEMERQQQLQMMQEQDQQLDGVFTTVGNLRQQAHDMGRELEDQAVMLEDVETLTERVGGKLQSGVRKVGHIIRKNEDTWSSCCIAVLIMVLILLLILVLVL